MQPSVQERLLGALGSAIVVTLLGYLLFAGMAIEIRVRGEQPITLLNLQAPRPRQHRPKPHVTRSKPRKASSPASPRNLSNKAAEIVTPPPAVRLPDATPVVSASKAGVGTAASAGASDRPGPGEGAGGEGNGAGSGGYGNGDGGGDVPPRLIKGRLKFSDLPLDLREAGIGGTVSVRYGVDVNGRVGDCIITASSGSTELDRLTCQLIQQRFRFDPSRDHEGQPVPSTIEENHSWEFDKNRDPLVHP